MSGYHVADDFGLCPSVNKAILELAQRGKIQATSVLVNGQGLSMLSSLTAFDSLQIGLHLNLTCGRPISLPEKVPALLDQQGQFLTLKSFIFGLLNGRIPPEQIHREVTAQWQLLVQIAGRIDHLDGHQHIHLLPMVFSTACRLLATQGSSRERRVRVVRNLSGSFRMLLLALTTYYHRAHFFCTYKQFPFTCLAHCLDYPQALWQNKRLDETTEVILHVAHPAFVDRSLDKTSYPYNSRVEQFEWCMKVLRNDR